MEQHNHKLVNNVLLRYYMAVDTISIQQLLERISGLLRSELRQSLVPYGLQQVHFDALHYLSHCNRYSDTPMAVTEYLGQTKGTVSQTLNVLVRKGYISKTPDEEDGRMMRLALTPAGKKLLRNVLPGDLLSQARQRLPFKEFNHIAQSLQQLLSTMQHVNQNKSFGQCATCVHNEKTSAQSYRCKLTQETLSPAETQLICREHSFA